MAVLKSQASCKESLSIPELIDTMLRIYPIVYRYALIAIASTHT